MYNTPARKPGVSVDMHLSYVKPAKLNETILIEANVLRAGTKLAYLTANVYLKDTDSLHLNKKKVVATATHTKYIL